MSTITPQRQLWQKPSKLCADARPRKTAPFPVPTAACWCSCLARCWRGSSPSFRASWLQGQAATWPCLPDREVQESSSMSQGASAVPSGAQSQPHPPSSLSVPQREGHPIPPPPPRRRMSAKGGQRHPNARHGGGGGRLLGSRRQLPL